MKPAAFHYERAVSATDACARLARLGEDAKVLAGGQSLVPMMNFRLARPTALVDVSRIEELRYVKRDGPSLRIGALTRHCELEREDGPLAGGYELLARAARFVGHFPIRARGTFGGSIAHADPCSEWCMVATALDAVVLAQGPSGIREVPIGDLFEGMFATSLAATEMLTEVRFDRAPQHASIQEVSRRHGDFAVVAVVVTADLTGGHCEDIRVVVGGVDEIPLRARAAEAALIGSELDARAIATASEAIGDEVEPAADLHGDADYRRNLARVLLRRALEEVLGDGR